jgi:hypothetical protein
MSQPLANGHIVHCNNADPHVVGLLRHGAWEAACKITATRTKAIALGVVGTPFSPVV